MADINNVLGEKVTYVVYQERPDIVDGVQQVVPLTYDEFEGSFNQAGGFDAATGFEDKERAINLATLQNEISTLLHQDFNYIVIERVDTRTSVFDESPEEPEEPTEDFGKDDLDALLDNDEINPEDGTEDGINQENKPK